MAKKITTEDFIRKARIIHGDKYSYDKTTYTRSKDKVVITCPKHGDFLQRADQHLEGDRCRKCSDEQRSLDMTKDIQYFKDKATIVHNDFYSYDKSIYTKSNKKVIIICPDHGEFTQLPRMHLSGNGCPDCSKHGFDINSTGYLYIHSVNDSTGIIGYKIGITNRAPHIRYSEINRDSTFKHTLLFYFSADGSTIRNLEKEIHKVCGTINGLQTQMKDGHTEVIPPNTINQALDMVFETINKDKALC